MGADSSYHANDTPRGATLSRQTNTAMITADHRADHNYLLSIEGAGHFKPKVTEICTTLCLPDHNELQQGGHTSLNTCSIRSHRSQADHDHTDHAISCDQCDQRSQRSAITAITNHDHDHTPITRSWGAKIIPSAYV